MSQENISFTEQITDITTIKIKQPKEYDIYKDSYLRYLGFSNEIGESFRKVTPRYFVIFTYVLEFGYFIGDTVHKGHKAYNDPTPVENKKMHVIKHSTYTILWQFFATCLIPPLCINIAVSITHNFLSKRKFRSSVIRYFPVTLGLMMIPLFSIYVDPVVGDVLDHYFEKHFL